MLFSYTHADEEPVDFVYRHLVARHPDLDGWIDRYRIVGGQDLLERIAEAMDRAERFLVFLSPDSVKSEWVTRELRRALYQEFGGKTDFVVPVIIESIQEVPAWLETKVWLELHKVSEQEGLERLRAAITGEPATPRPPEDNLEKRVVRAENDPSAAVVQFTVHLWTADVGFVIHTLAPIQGVMWQFPTRKNLGMVSASKLREERAFGFATASPRIERGHPFLMGVKFDDAIADPVDAIASIEPWDGTGGTQGSWFPD